MSEEQKLTETILDKVENNPPNPETGDNLQVANNLINSLQQPFAEALMKLSNNQLRKLIRTLVRFPFVDPKLRLHTEKEKVAFMYGERLIYANMVKRARNELERTFGEMEKENENKEIGSSETNIDVAKTSDP